MISSTNKYLDFVDSLARKVSGLSGARRTNTPKQRQQASSARCEAMNLEAARDAAEKIAVAYERGCLPNDIAQFKTMKSIIDATELRISCGTNYYSEYYLDHGNYRDTSPEAVKFRAWLQQGASPESEAHKQQRDKKFQLDQLLSELRGAQIDGFFPTPDLVLDEMFIGLNLAGAQVLEPSAGIGSIADRAKSEGANVICFEVNSRLCQVLHFKGHAYIHDDFLRCDAIPAFGYVLMNPPYENDSAPIHVRHAFDFLIPAGELVAIMPQTCLNYHDSNRRVRRDFSAWLQSKSHSLIPLPDGAFESAFNPTGVSTCILRIKN